MAIYYSIFGRRCMNVGGDVWYAAMDANGSVNSYELRPSYNPTLGIWEAANEESDVAYDYGKGSYPENVDPSKCLFELRSGDITEENWLSKSIADDAYPVVELERLLYNYGENKKYEGECLALYMNKIKSDLDIRGSRAAFEQQKEIISLIENMKKQKLNEHRV